MAKPMRREPVKNSATKALPSALQPHSSTVCCYRVRTGANLLIDQRMDVMTSQNPQSKNDVRAIFRDIFREVAFAEAHFDAYDSIMLARMEGRPEISPYHDFFEITMFSHMAGMILSASRILDRDDRAASIHWMLRQIEGRPQEFGIHTEAIAEVRAQLEQADVSIKKIHSIRNKKIAHLERMTKTGSESFWKEKNSTDDEIRELLVSLRRVMEGIERILWPDDTGCGLMFAFENETQDVFAALNYALKRGYNVLGTNDSD
jgi:hypothetical protein